MMRAEWHRGQKAKRNKYAHDPYCDPHLVLLPLVD
jgi:hypothetical protein